MSFIKRLLNDKDYKSDESVPIGAVACSLRSILEGKCSEILLLGDLYHLHF